MTDDTQNPPALKKFVYPFQKTGEDGEDASEVIDPQTYYSALANAEDGFYPIGANGQWHGGIHFGSQTGGTLAQDAGIRCIADGEVIAYRIDNAYPTVAYDTCGDATYSTGFTLVRHRLQLPPAPEASETPATEDATVETEPTEKSEEPSLLLYSLYMHLMHWKDYEDDTTKPRPAYWGDTLYLVDDAANDADQRNNPHIPDDGIGLNLRDADGEIAGYAPRGVKLQLGAEGTQSGYYAVTKVVSGEVVPAGLTDAYAFKGELTETAADPTSDKVVVLASPAAVDAGDLMGYLGQYQRYVDTNPLGSSCSERPLVQLDVFAGDDAEDFIAKSRERAEELDDKQKTLLFIETGAKLALPADADLQISVTDGITLDETSPADGAWAKVRTGALEIVAKATLSGYKASTQSYANGSVLSRILDADGNAIELDAYNALTDKSAYTQREVMVPSGDPVWVQRSLLGDRPLTTGRTMDAWSEFPLQTDDATGPEAAYPRVVAINTLDEAVIEADGTRWWEVTVGTADGSGRSGWAREKDHAKVKLCTPWDWPGFEVVEADETPPATFYANHVAKQPQTPKDEQDTLEAQGATAESAQLFARLYDLIDQDDDKKLSSTEIRQALKKPWLAQGISRLITRYDSEWAGPMDKWDAIDPLIPDTRKADWSQEKKRIESLLWWDVIEGKDRFPTDTKATSFHPVGLISNFSFAPCYCHRDLTVKEIKSIVIAMRKSEKTVYDSVGDQILTKSNISIPDVDKSYDRLTEEINSAFETYDINTCIRKIHFLAQTYWESDRLRTTKEYGDGHRYEPYVGRGLMQLTWESGYEKYESYSGISCVDDPDLVSNSLHNSIDSAGWYWNRGKEFTIGKKWSAPSSAPQYVKKHKPTYLKQKVTYTSGGEKKTYGTFDLGLVADDDYTDVISWLVNGGGNGLSERRTYVSKLKEIMNYESDCINKKK